MTNILSFIAMTAILALMTILVQGLVNFVVETLFKKKETPTQNVERRQPQYTEDEIRTAQYLEQKAELDKRYYVFRQLMHHATKNYDRRP